MMKQQSGVVSRTTRRIITRMSQQHTDRQLQGAPRWPAVVVAVAVAVLALVAISGTSPSCTVQAFRPPSVVSSHTTTRTRTTTTMVLRSTRAPVSSAPRPLQDLMFGEEDGQMIMDALRGKNLNDADAALAGQRMQLVDNIQDGGGGGSKSGLPYTYDPRALERFFSQRPLAILTRLVQLATSGGGYAFGLLLDRLLSRHTSPDQQVLRASQLRDLLTSLGPFYIKIGQALSIRPDILSPRSMVELQKLCDKVPCYDSAIAYATIERELGRPVRELFADITAEPVAAASLGQVYKARLAATGEAVAVKVQRPAVLETVSLDLYLARQVGMLVRKIPALAQRLDPVALLDEFAYRFYQELDYNLECANGLRMEREMKVLPMVKIPKNYPAYTSRRVHVAEWIEGEKLSQSTADDVSALVNLGVITYLTQLLESGFFHADPHPGNMLRTTDGKLAILDFGLMTEITENQKCGMVEAIAHLINRDYQEIGQDFINLDFIPKGTDTRPIVPALTKVFDVALAGGGAKSINFQELAADLAEITYEFPFRIPPYFALVIRAISVLEGIALVGNPSFAIIDEAYPYIARRLMTDRSPRLRAALRYMIYGKDGVFDAENAIDLLQALEKFTAVRDDGDGSAFKVDGVRGTKMVGAAGDFTGSQKVDTTDRDTDARFRITTTTTKPKQSSSIVERRQQLQRETNDDARTIREALKFFFSAEGDVFREFLSEEIVNVVDASGRGVLEEVSRRLGWTSVIPSFLRRASMSDKDRRTVEQLQKLFEFLLGDYEKSVLSSNSSSSARLRKAIPVLREFSPQLQEFGLLLAVRLTEKNIGRSMTWATQRLAEADSRRARGLSATVR